MKKIGRPKQPVKKLFPLREGGEKLWNQLIREMPPGILEAIDAGALTTMCRWYEVWRYWDKHTTSDNIDRAYKATCMAGAAYKHFFNAAKEFGLTPKSRKELNYDAEENGTDVFSEWMKKRMQVEPVQK